MNSDLIIAKYQLYAKILQAYLRWSQDARTLEKLNEIYSLETSEADPILSQMQFITLPQKDW